MQGIRSMIFQKLSFHSLISPQSKSTARKKS